MFDSVAFDEPSLTMLDQYVKHIRPLLQPRCNYVLVTRNGTQYSKLCVLMSVLVFQAIGKYIHPTRFPQIVETESANRLSIEEKDLITMIRNIALELLRSITENSRPDRLH